MTRLAVVIVTYNSATVLPGLLAALPPALAGSGDVSVIAVDNASADATPTLLAASPVVDEVVAMGRNAGYASAINAATSRARDADAVLILNPDVRPAPGMAARLLAALADPSVGIAVPRLHHPDGSTARSLRRDPTILRALGEAALGGHRAGRLLALGEVVVDDRAYAYASDADWATGAAWLVSRRCLETVGSWDESFFLYGEETDYALRARAAGLRLRFVPDAAAIHIGGDAPVSPRLWALLQRNRAELAARRHRRPLAWAYRLVLLVNAGVRALLGRRVHAAAALALLRSQPEAVRRAGGDAGELPRRARRRRVLIIVQNLPVPMDRRVWLQARTLVAAGIGVSVICPRGAGQPRTEDLEGVRLHRYRPAPPARSRWSYVVEFAWCWLATAGLSVAVMAREGFGIIQACNPPDTYFALAAMYKPFGVRFVFDQHDLCPEVYESRFGASGSLWHRALLALERATYRTADHVIATNDSYRRVAIERGGLPSEAVTVVRNGPDPQVLSPGPPVPALRTGRAHLCAYLGVMGPQDGVDGLLRAVAVLVHEMGRRDVHVALLGFGDELASLRQLAEELDLGDWVTFTGPADTAMIVDHLSTATVGLCPDPPTPFNDASTMNKTMEYMAFGLPVVAYDLTETRVSAGPAAAYVTETGPAGFAKALASLLDDPDRRAQMSVAGRQRIEDHLAWPHQARAYVDLYQGLLDRTVPVTTPRHHQESTSR